jgi:16S rRNA (uracil1498-N3)-methyltransferase
VTLLQAITKGKSMELIVQKATELGVARIVPILTSRTVPRLSAEDASSKAAKWRSIAIDAIKQCGSPWLPQIDQPIELARILAGFRRLPGGSIAHEPRGIEQCDLSLVASLQPGSIPLRQCLSHQRSQRKLEEALGSLAFWVGPEGDFTPQEYEAILGAGATPVSLGSRVLRAETAALYLLTVINYETH